MKSTLVHIGLACACISVARADFNPVALTPGSFNADVVVEKTASKPLEAYCNATMDGGTNNNGDTFYEQGYASFPLAPGAVATGLPHPGATFIAVSDANRTFQMPADYTVNNALFLGNYAGYTTGTLTLSTPAPFTTLSFVGAAGNGPVVNSVTIHYAGGGTQTASLNIDDWFGGSGIAWYANGRVNPDGGLDNFSATGSTTPRLTYNDIGLTDTTDNVLSIDFQYTSGGRGGIFAVSGSSNGTTFTPVAVTGFNRDMIIEAAAPKSQFTPTVSVTLDGGPTLGGAIFYETGLNGYTDGLPHPGGNVVFGNHTWAMASDYTVNNCVFVGNYTGLSSATVTLNAPATFSGLSFLTASGNGPTSISVVVTHSGGGTETFTISSLDWGNSSSAAYTPGNRMNPLGLGRGATFYLHPADITLADTANAVTSISFTYVSNGRAVIYAVAGQTSSGGSYSPVAVSGFNADAVIEKAALPPASLYTATTVSMDGGTNNIGNTWYEQGYDPAWPATGLPAAGSTLTSTSLSDHHYQMPASYTANDAVYVDAAHPTANLTIASPAPYSAISFLSATANGRVTNACIIQYADHTSESNYFVSQDWFFNSPFAFNANGRVNLDSRQLNNVNNGNPRLYEAQFALGNVVSPITNIVLQFLGAQNSTRPNDGRMVVFALSATAGAVPPIIAPSTPASPPLMLEGTNMVLTAQLTGGTAPITNTWYFSSNGGTTWSVVPNGGFFSGATTASLTNSSIGYTNSGQYELVAQNVAGSVTSAVATVTVLSGLPDVAHPGDPITAYQPNGGSSPGNEGVEHAIEDLVGNDPGKYLNFATGSSPFVGPIGFVVTPSLGKTIVSALRLYTANDAPERDPADYTLEGSNDGGATWTTIASGPLAMPTARNNAASAAVNPLTQNLQEVHFANAASYSSYRWSCMTVRDNSTTSLMQIGEVELLGVQTPTAPTILSQTGPSVKTYVGSSPTFFVQATGYPLPLSYQWARNGTPIGSATTSSYTLANAQAADSAATFTCVVTNTVGPASSAPSVLTVIAAPIAAYPVTIMGDAPQAWLRLNEGPDDGNSGANNGVTAYDSWGGHNGYYTNVILGQTGFSTLDGDTATYFGKSFGNYIPTTGIPDSCVEAIGGIDFAKTNASAAFSVEAWVMFDPNLPTAALIPGAGIITKGYGNGGEQFNLDCGGNGNSFRFFVRDTSGNTHGTGSAVTPEPGVWHHVVGVLDEANSNVVLYVDGLRTGTGSVNPTNGLLSSTYPVTIGSRAADVGTNNNLLFYGTVDEAVIYSHALSSNQVMNHFLAAGVAPRFTVAQTVNPTNITVSEGSSTNLYEPYYGSPTTYAQWYRSTDFGANWAPLPGQTSSTLALANVTAAQNGYQYYLQVTNSYGATNSATTILAVISGPPQLQVDLPSEFVVYAGRTATLAVTVSGTPPFTYQWQSNGVVIADGGRFTGTHTNALSIANTQPGDSATYQVFVSNSQGGPVPSTPTALYVETTPDFNTNGAGWTANGGAAFANDMLTLTDGQNSEARSSFYNYPQNIDAFYASFVYQDVNPPSPQADGFAFVLQNDPRGTSALGGGGGGLGLSGITPSWATTFNLFTTPGISFGTNGDNGSPYANTAPVDISSGDHIQVTLVYANGTAQLTLRDLDFGVTYTTNRAFNLPAILGADTAYVGFTAGTGGFASTQTVSNFVFNSYPTLSAKLTAPNTVTVSWPAASGGFKLQSRASLTTGSWVDVAAPVNLVGSQNQVVISPATGTHFYQLVLQPSEP